MALRPEFVSALREPSSSPPQARSAPAALDTLKIPPFRAHPAYWSGHAQTLASVWFSGRAEPYTARQERVQLAEGDLLILHDDCPRDWTPGRPVALLVHGLAGNHTSGYMRRVAAKLVARGTRVYRVDLRGCGAGAALAKLPYHAGRSEDLASAIECIRQACPGSRVGVAGFSLGGNILLKLLGEWGATAPEFVSGGVAVCPPVDLATCVANMARGVQRLYDRHFTGLLCKEMRFRRRNVPGAAAWRYAKRPTTLWEFDDSFTAPVSGFGDAPGYYRACSAAKFTAAIRARRGPRRELSPLSRVRRRRRA